MVWNELLNTFHCNIRYRCNTVNATGKDAPKHMDLPLMYVSYTDTEVFPLLSCILQYTLVLFSMRQFHIFFNVIVLHFLFLYVPLLHLIYGNDRIIVEVMQNVLPSNILLSVLQYTY